MSKMGSKFLLKNLWLNIVWLSFSALSYDQGTAAPLPEKYPMVEINASQVGPVVDPELLIWLDHYDGTKNSNSASKSQDGFSLDDNKFTFLLKKIRNYASNNHSKELQKVVEEISKDIVDFRSKVGVDHPLSPYLVEEIVRVMPGQWSKWQKWLLSSDSSYVRSCPVKKKIKSDFSDRNFVLNNLNEVTQYVQLVKVIKDDKYVGNIERTLQKSIYRETREKYKQVLQDLDAITPEEPSETLAETSKTRVDTSHLPFYSAKSQARSGRCVESQKSLKRLLQKNDVQVELEDAYATLDDLGSCYRVKKGQEERINVWNDLLPDFEKRYGYTGWAKLSYNIGRLYWNSDHNDIARKTLRDIIARSELEKESLYYAKALLLLSQIDFNEMNYEQAVVGFIQFIEKFPKFPENEEVLMNIVTIFAEERKWDKVIEYAQKITQIQEEKPADLRDVSVIGFSLFWAGRGFVEQGDAQKGLQNWKRLASEFFSTYYGAMGHFMLEKFTGKIYALNPVETQKFNSGLLSDPYSKEDRVIVDRVQNLLRLGMKREAACEVNEIRTEKSEFSKNVSKSLFYYASGDWLSAVRLYGSLPHAFRINLPSGMERILFPKRYEALVDDYAERLKLDKDFVLSLIRQESIFDPFALSQVGAKGLMQLMGKTAGLELVSVKKSSYISSQKKRELTSKSKHDSYLFEADANILLGTHHLQGLLNKYEDLVFTLSAYNAGANAVDRWKSKFQTADILCFIERIPYKETRNYVKLILRNYFYYKKWYNQENSKFAHLEEMTRTLMALRSQ